MKIFVCSPYQGKKENIDKAKMAMRHVVDYGHVPVAPHVMLHSVMDDADPFQRTAAIEFGLEILKLCDEIWIFGVPKVPKEIKGTLTEAFDLTYGMQQEFKLSRKLGIPYRDKTEVVI